MSEFVRLFEKVMNKNELYSLAKSFHDLYEPLMQDYLVWNIIDKLTPDDVLPLLSHLKTDVIGHKIVNDVIMKYYPCERVVKYHLAKRFLKRRKDVTVFEMNINKSRLDIGRINGKSYGYEIKTDLDKLTKLSRQLNDYSKVLEYVYVITTKKHLDKVFDLVPQHCGVIRYEIQGNRFFMKELKPASISPNIDSKTQVNNLSSTDLKYILRMLSVNNIPTTRKKREEILFCLMKNIDFNEMFKKAVKNKFKERCRFLRNNFNEIQPIDAQAFFTTSVDPYWVYYKDSSIV